jgi:hypothetical protein
VEEAVVYDRPKPFLTVDLQEWSYRSQIAGCRNEQVPSPTQLGHSLDNGLDAFPPVEIEEERLEARLTLQIGQGTGSAVGCHDLPSCGEVTFDQSTADIRRTTEDKDRARHNLALASLLTAT